jgi:hypothetical protein
MRSENRLKKAEAAKQHHNVEDATAVDDCCFKYSDIDLKD